MPAPLACLPGTQRATLLLHRTHFVSLALRTRPSHRATSHAPPSLHISCPDGASLALPLQPAIGLAARPRASPAHSHITHTPSAALPAPHPACHILLPALRTALLAYLATPAGAADTPSHEAPATTCARLPALAQAEKNCQPAADAAKHAAASCLPAASAACSCNTHSARLAMAGLASPRLRLAAASAASAAALGHLLAPAPCRDRSSR